MSWELIHRRLVHPSESVMKAICRHQTLASLPKHFPEKLDQARCTICYKAKMKLFPKGKTVDTTNLQPVELINKNFVLYNVTYIRGFERMLT